MTDDVSDKAGEEFEWIRRSSQEPRTDAEDDDSPELSRPPEQWREDGDPTNSSTWKWLKWATLFNGLVLLFWSVPLGLYGVVERLGMETATLGVGVVVVAMIVLTVVVRLIVLPVLLVRDAGNLRASEAVAWRPSRGFYLLTGAVFATLACGYYLFKRQRYVGNPTLLTNDELVYYDGRRVASNWHQVVALSLVLSMSAGGIGSLLTLSESVNADLSTALFAPVLLVFVLALLCRFVLLPVALAKDAAAVRASDVDWNPNGTLYAVVGYVFALPVVVLYLYRRHHRTGDLFGH